MTIWRGFAEWTAAGVLVGIDTAMLYPTLLAAIRDVAHPSWRGSAIGVYRLWRDLGYAVGALLAGAIADAFGMDRAIVVVAVITAASGLMVARRMPETHPSSGGADLCDDRVRLAGPHGHIRKSVVLTTSGVKQYSEAGAQGATSPRTGLSSPTCAVICQVHTNLLYARRSGQRAATKGGPSCPSVSSPPGPAFGD
jgi:MFS family permease